MYYERISTEFLIFQISFPNYPIGREELTNYSSEHFPISSGYPRSFLDPPLNSPWALYTNVIVPYDVQLIKLSLGS